MFARQGSQEQITYNDFSQTPSKYDGSFVRSSAKYEAHQASTVQEEPVRVEPDQDLVYLVRDYFEPILEIESGTELLKTELAMRKDFSLAAAFSMFSRTL